MRSLARIETLRSALVATSVTTLACGPRLLQWTNRTEALWFLFSMLWLCGFVLWAFVFAWLPRRSGRGVLVQSWRWQDWLEATVWGALYAAAIAWWIDPVLRQLTPADYPTDWGGWLTGTLFTLAFVQLFLSYAPFALFHRLFGGVGAAGAGTVFFGLFLLAIQLQRVPVAPAPGLALVLLGARAASALVAIRLLVRGGPALVAWWALCVQARLLPGLPWPLD